MDSTPVPSPHPVFGRRPSWWTRIFGNDEDKYWPTIGDVERFRLHMRRVGNDEREPDGWPVWDPMLTGWTYSHDEHWEARQYVKMVRDQHNRKPHPIHVLTDSEKPEPATC